MSSKDLDATDEKTRKVMAGKPREDIEGKLRYFQDMIMQLDGEESRKGLELLQGLREILQGGRVMDEIERACEEAGLDEKEKKTILDCIGHYVREEVVGSAELLREAIRRCWGSDDCDLCRRVLERLEPSRKVA